MRVAVGADSGEVSNVTVNIDYLVAKAKPDVMLLTGTKRFFTCAAPTKPHDVFILTHAPCVPFPQATSPTPTSLRLTRRPAIPLRSAPRWTAKPTRYKKRGGI